MTLRTALATVHGKNLMDIPYRIPTGEGATQLMTMLGCYMSMVVCSSNSPSTPASSA